MGIVEPQRPERRIPQDAGADRGTDMHVVVGRRDGLAGEQRLQLDLARPLIIPQRAGVGEDRQADAELLGHAEDRELELRRRAPVEGAAQRVEIGAGREVARPDARGGKAAHDVRSHEELIQHAQARQRLRHAGRRVEHRLVAEAGDMAGLAAQHQDEVGVDLVVVANVAGRAQEVDVAANAGEVLAQLGEQAAGRRLVAVQRVEYEIVADERGPYLALQHRRLDRQRGFAVDEAVRQQRAGRNRRRRRGVHRVGRREGVDEIRIDVVAVVETRRQIDLLLIGGIAQRNAQVLAQRQAEAQATADGARIVGLEIVLQRLLGEDVDGGQHAIVEKDRVCEGEVEATGVLAILDGALDEMSEPEQVAFGDADLRQEALRRRVAARDREFAGRLLLDVYVDDHPIGRRAGLVGDPDALEVVQVLEPTLGPVDEHAVVGVALGDVELAANDVVAGAGVAADVDALDVDAGALLEHEGDVDDARLEVAVATPPHLGEGVAALRHFDRDVLHGLFHLIGVVDGARAHAQASAQRDRIDIANVGHDVDAAEAVEVALLDRVGDDEAPLLGIVLRHRGPDADVGVAVLQIEPPEQLAVGLDAVAIVEVVALEEAEDAGLAGLDHVLQAAVGKGLVAFEHDALDRGLRPLRDLEHEIDAVVGQFDDLRIDADVIAASRPVDFENALDVGLDSRARERAARLRLDFLVELLVLDPAVALEHHAIEHRRLDHGHHDLRAGAADLHILEQAGVDQRLVGIVDLDVVEALAGAQPEIGLDRAGLKPAIAVHDDLPGGGTSSGSYGGNCGAQN